MEKKETLLEAVAFFIIIIFLASMMVSSKNLYLNHQANMKTMSEIQNSTEQSANNPSLYFGGSSLTSGNWAGYVSKYSNFNSGELGSSINNN